MKNRIVYIAFILSVVVFGCRSVKNIPESEMLLDKVVVDHKIKDLTKEQLNYYIKQQPNSKIFGAKFHLWLYNLAGKDTSKGVNKWLMNIGEEPVLYDQTLVEQSTSQIQQFIQNKGCFNAFVKDTTIKKRKRRAKVKYIIHSGNEYKLNDVKYGIEDPEIASLVESNVKKSLLKPGTTFDANIHDKERERITGLLRNKGYYSFSKEYVYFVVDTLVGGYLVNDSLKISNAIVEISRDKDSSYLHPKYKIKDVFFRLNYDAHKALADKDAFLNEYDTLVYDDYHFLYRETMGVKAEVLANSTYIKPGQLFQTELVSKTHALLSNLGVYRFINIRFNEAKVLPGDTSSYKWLNCHIQLVSSKTQSYAFEIEGMNSSGNLGAGGNFKYQHKNLFKGAEVLDLSLGSSVQNQFSTATEEFSTTEVGVESRIVFPKFWMPFKIEGFRQRFNPKTSLSISYNFQDRPDYIRTMGNGRIGYIWKSNKKTSHTLVPLEINLVGIEIKNDDFWDNIKDTYLRYSYEDHLITSTSYSVVYNEQEVNKRRDFWYGRIGIEEAGNVLNLASSIFLEQNSENYYELSNIRYAQYVKGDIDIRYHHYANPSNSMAYRLFVGVGYPYGNLDVIPFEKRYFSGGANSIRAWSVRSLGPGSYVDSTSTTYNQTGDIKLEFNIEYRYKLFWIMEGALFLDVGNVYTIKKVISPQGGLFKFDDFYKKLAIGTGLGLRFDMKYFLFRIDGGLKVYDPASFDSNPLILGQRKYTWNDVGFNFAIGYPF